MCRGVEKYRRTVALPPFGTTANDAVLTCGLGRARGRGGAATVPQPSRLQGTGRDRGRGFVPCPVVGPTGPPPGFELPWDRLADAGGRRGRGLGRAGPQSPPAAVASASTPLPMPMPLPSDYLGTPPPGF
jgi:hypothetical protein